MNKETFKDSIPHQFFERQVNISGKSLAVLTENQCLTYEELNQKANQLAHHLIEDLNITPGATIGVCTSHEPSRVLSLMAILKAGAVYVPVDPFYPAEMINYMTSKIDAQFILTDRFELLDRQGELTASVVNLDNIHYTQYESHNLSHPIDSQDPMYIIFTSGSTGRPKAVAVSHRAAYNHFAWVMRYTSFTSTDTWLQTINPSFDPSMHELMAPLMLGGRIALIGGTKKLDSREITEAIIRHQATHITTVPTMLTLLVNTASFSSCVSLKQVCVGGEVFRPALAEKAMSLLPKSLFHNVYGPTEATIMASGWPISHPENREALPIGPAIDNMKYYLRTDADEIVELTPGLEGELCISGVSLANGYVNDPELTAEVFIKNPKELNTQSIYRHLYLSGDRCRIDDNGDIYCLGRLDGQVKINGQRLELAEVEYQFSSLSDICDVAVFKIDNDLTAAVVPNEPPLDEKKWLASVRARIEKKLPQFMCPKRIVVIDTIPKQAVSAKADRKKLADLLSRHSENAVCDNMPQDLTSVTQTIVEIIGELMPGITAQDCLTEMSFADLGLDSVDLQMLTLKLSQQYQISLRTEELFEYYTVEKLTDFIEAQIKK